MNRQVWRSREAGWTGRVSWVIACSLGVLLPAPAAAWQRSKQGPVRRAARPAGGWDKVTASTFSDNAFGALQGSRPTFNGVGRPPVASAMAEQTDAGPSTDGFKWSTLVSEGTLTDEIKDLKAALAAATTRPADFKGGGYDRAREGFSVAALAFAVIAEFDQDVRWKKDAATARDLFARVGFNCKVGTDQSLAEAKLRVADLEAMLEGGSPQGKPDRDEDFRWSQVAGRPALMTRLEAADAALASGVAEKDGFVKQVDRLLHEAEMVAAIGEAVQRPDYEYHDDDTYRSYAAAMRDAALKLRAACQRKDYDAARAAAGDLKKSCDTCHGDYRN